jgi:hypothetical protein
MVADTVQPPSIRSSPETSTPRPGVHSRFLLMRYQHIILAKPQTVRRRCTGNLTQIAPDPFECRLQNFHRLSNSFIIQITLNRSFLHLSESGSVSSTGMVVAWTGRTRLSTSIVRKVNNFCSSSSLARTPVHGRQIPAMANKGRFWTQRGPPLHLAAVLILAARRDEIGAVTFISTTRRR